MRRVFVFILTSVAFISFLNLSFAEKPSLLFLSLSQALKQEKQACDNHRRWEKERAAIEQKILAAKLKLGYLERQKELYERYNALAKKRLDLLKDQERETEFFAEYLEPFLLEIVERLEKAVRNDLPFLQKERIERIEKLKGLLGDYKVPAVEKAKQVLETLVAEAKYGRTSDVYDGTIKLEDKTCYVRFLRVGRLALFSSTPDGSYVAVYDRATGAWKPISEEQKNNVLRAFDIIDGSVPVNVAEGNNWLVAPIESELVMSRRNLGSQGE